MSNRVSSCVVAVVIDLAFQSAFALYRAMPIERPRT